MVAAPDAHPIRVIIADDDPLVRRALRDALQQDGIVVAGEVPNGRDAVDLAVHYRPDVVLMDIVMPGVDGVAATRMLQTQAPEVRVLLIAGADDEQLAIAGLRAGATGFMRKAAGIGEISGAVRRTAAGESVVDPALVRVLIERLRSAPEGAVGLRPVSSPLTDREWEMLDGLCVGLGPEQLAATFVVSIETVRTHIKSIFRKLDVHSQAEAVERAAALRRPSPPLIGER